MKSVLVFLVCLLLITNALATCENIQTNSSIASIPGPAKKAGYIQKTFESNLSRESIDITDSRDGVHQWYLDQFFGRCPTSAQALSWPNEVFTLNGFRTTCSTLGNSTIATAATRPSTKEWVGLAFGGGAYIEATLSFDPENTVNALKGTQWPAFWAMSVEHLAQLSGEQWDGMEPGYVHFAEVDIFEYDVWGFAGKNTYGGAIHDWYGQLRKTCPEKSFCRVSNSPDDGTKFSNFVIKTKPNTNFKSPHKYAILWIPATDLSNGSITYYFDGIATRTTVEWHKYKNQPPPPKDKDWAFGILDQQHVSLLISTGQAQPMQIVNISVWQKNTCHNLQNK